MTKDHGSSIKDDTRYEKLREHGNSKKKSARIAYTSPHKTASRGGKAGKYEDQNREQVCEKATKLGIPGRSRICKDDLVHALRDH
ncbi:MAG: Rho termination factor [Candidatus Macondimonas sp.]